MLTSQSPNNSSSSNSTPTNLKQTKVAIVGGGLSGLYAANLLAKQGIDYVLLEARQRLGGRIESSSGQSDTPFDLGPTWFWPALQPQFEALLKQLGLVSFAQFEQGDMLVERTISGPAERMRGYASSPASMRLQHGMGALIDALTKSLNAERLRLGESVQSIRKTDVGIELESISNSGHRSSWRATKVLIAVPPRLATQGITFIPELPTDLQQAWSDTPTWMAPHAKYLAVYERPFWRDHGLSGSAHSVRGPLAEIHDASVPAYRTENGKAQSSNAALFGFLGVPSHMRQQLSEDELKSHCRGQLTRLFGAQASRPVREYLKDWAQDRHTATAADQQAGGQHKAAPARLVVTGQWQDVLVGIASEWSASFPGYLAGAVEAAEDGLKALKLTSP